VVGSLLVHQLRISDEDVRAVLKAQDFSDAFLNGLEPMR
jgi:hypothetical protein